MAEADSRQHGQDQPTHRPDCQRMSGQARLRQPAQVPGGHQQSSDGQPGVGQVQRPQQRHAPDAACPPLPQAQAVQHGHGEEQRRQPGAGHLAKAGDNGRGYRQRTAQQTPHQPGPRRHLASQPQSPCSEEGNHPPADDRHQRRYQPQRGQHAAPLQAIVDQQQAIQVQRLAGTKQRQHQHERGVMPLPGPQDQPSEGQQQSQGVGQFERRQRGQRDGQEPGQAACQP